MTKNDPRMVLREKATPFRGYFQIDRYRLKHQRFNGGWSEEVSREVFERGHAASVLPYDPVRDTVILIEQFRVGAYAAGIEPWLIEVVAGIIEPGEEPEAVVRREALEEAGCEIGDLEPICKVLMSPGGCSETTAMFCGRIDSTNAGGVFGLEHENEDIRAFVVPAEEALARLARSEYANATIVISLQWLALNRDRLRRKWQA